MLGLSHGVKTDKIFSHRDTFFISSSIILSLASLNLLPEKTKIDIPWKNRPIPYPNNGHMNQRYQGEVVRLMTSRFSMFVSFSHQRLKIAFRLIAGNSKLGVENSATSQIERRGSIEILLRLYFPLGLQIVFPERGDIPQPLDNRGKMFDDIIHFLFGVIDREAETDRPMGGRERNTHCPEDVRRLQ